MKEIPPYDKEKVIYVTKIGSYRDYDVYTSNIDSLMAKEAVATAMPHNEGSAGFSIIIRTEAYEILKSRPDFLERIYEHEVREGILEEHVKHGQDEDILKFLKDNGYDFGNP